jgi:hypothetical protein
MRVKLLVVSLILLLGLILFGVGVLGGGLLGRCVREALMSGPAEEENPSQEKGPAYGLPLEITIQHVPEAPEEIQGPLAPVEEQKRQD